MVTLRSGSGLRRPVSLGATGLVLVVGIALRVQPWFNANAFRGVLEYDDGVYYGAAALLLEGDLPYRDVTLVHPPGTAILLLPAALVGRLLSDSWGMAAARLLVLAVAVANTLLVGALARRLPLPVAHREAAGLVAAAAYAMLPGAVEAEHTAMLEPLVTLPCLLATLLLTATECSRRRLALAGGLLALALSTKLFAGAYLVVALLWLARARGRRAVISLAAGALAGLAVLVGPFALAAPGAMWRDVVVTQLARPLDAGMSRAARLVDMAGFGQLPLWAGLAGLLVLLAVLARSAASAGLPPYWVGVGVVTVVGFTASASYFPHYGAFLAPVLAVLLGLAVAGGRWSRVGVGAVLALFLAGSVVQDARYGGQGDLRALGRELPVGDCVFAEWASVAVAADRFTGPTDDCPMWLDGRGVVYTQNTDWPAGRDFYFAGFTEDERWQAELRRQLRAADHLVLSRSPALIPEWSEQTRALALASFARVRVLPGSGRTSVELWSRLPGR